MFMIFDLQGHRGARGLKPENTLPSFEAALDWMVSSLETDLHITQDGIPVLSHDECLTDKLARTDKASNVPPLGERPRISDLTLAQIRGYLADVNPDPRRFPLQDSLPTPAAAEFAARRNIPLCAPPALTDLLDFVAGYAGELGHKTGKTPAQQEKAQRVHFNLELKRVPFRPEFMGDYFDGKTVGELEAKMIAIVRQAGVVERTTVQCFDHRVIKAVRALEPGILGAALTANTAPASIPNLIKDAAAQIYSPDFEFLDERQVRQAHSAGIRVVPYTLNDFADMERLLDWGVDGIITDYPDRLASLLQRCGIAW
jgi:glycerophosphoryl diester phosphodiesterase